MISGEKMRKLLIYLIRGYQLLPLHSHSCCRCIPTCSNYMIEALETYGLKKGLILGIKRIINCRPNGIYGYQPLPKDL